ncbi:MAG: GntR family transcriptional regulator [Deltaproteobacteria bacterium]|nr:GntR family transcriptional regulator [Deltaproteobacteria bacterium]
MHKILSDKFRSYISDGKWTPGSILPTEQELCDQFSASRTTIRKALDTLMNEDLIERKAGRGTWVRETEGNQEVWRIEGSSLEYPFPELITVKILSTANVVADPSDPLLARFEKNEMLIRIEVLRVLNDTPLTLSYIFMSEEDAKKALASFEGESDLYLFQVLERVTGRKAQEIQDSISAVVASGDVAEKLEVSPGTPLSFLNNRTVTDTDGRIMLVAQLFLRSDLQKISIFRTREHKGRR